LRSITLRSFYYSGLLRLFLILLRFLVLILFVIVAVVAGRCRVVPGGLHVPCDGQKWLDASAGASLATDQCRQSHPTH
jgi:hypothetical protein